MNINTFLENIKLDYNSPVILTYLIISLIAGILNTITRGKTNKVSVGMTDDERYKILKDRSLVNIPTVTNNSLANTSINDWNDINRFLGKQKRKLIHKLATEFGVFKDYENPDIDIRFHFSNNNFEESYSKQKKNFTDFAKMFSVFDDIVSCAVGIEVHNRNKEGYKPDPTLNVAFVLIGAYKEGKYIVPVKLEIKEFNDKDNALYVAIALEKIKATEVSGQGNTNNGVTQNSRSVANISLAQLFRKINPNDKQFIKYIPNRFLNKSQLEAKAVAIEEDSKKYADKKTSTQNNSGSGNLSDKPGGLKSKDDTIYDGMFEDGDLYFGGLRTRWNSRHFYQVNDNISRHLGAYNALR